MEKLVHLASPENTIGLLAGAIDKGPYWEVINKQDKCHPLLWIQQFCMMELFQEVDSPRVPMRDSATLSMMVLVLIPPMGVEPVELQRRADQVPCFGPTQGRRCQRSCRWYPWGPWIHLCLGELETATGFVIFQRWKWWNHSIIQGLQFLSQTNLQVTSCLSRVGFQEASNG